MHVHVALNVLDELSYSTYGFLTWWVGGIGKLRLFTANININLYSYPPNEMPPMLHRVQFYSI